MREFSRCGFRATPRRGRSELYNLETVRRGERIERNVPLIGRNRLAQPLQRPADADQPCAALPQSGKRAVVMTLAAPEARTAAIDRDQRHQDEVRLDHRCAAPWLHHPERTG